MARIKANRLKGIVVVSGEGGGGFGSPLVGGSGAGFLGSQTLRPGTGGGGRPVASPPPSVPPSMPVPQPPSPRPPAPLPPTGGPLPPPAPPPGQSPPGRPIPSPGRLPKIFRGSPVGFGIGIILDQLWGIITDEDFEIDTPRRTAGDIFAELFRRILGGVEFRGPRPGTVPVPAPPKPARPPITRPPGTRAPGPVLGTVIGPAPTGPIAVPQRNFPRRPMPPPPPVARPNVPIPQPQPQIVPRGPSVQPGRPPQIAVPGQIPSVPRPVVPSRTTAPTRAPSRSPAATTGIITPLTIFGLTYAVGRGLTRDSARDVLRDRTRDLVRDFQPDPLANPFAQPQPQTGGRVRSPGRAATSDCVEVQRRRRRKGKCREGFFRETRDSTRYETWRVRDCLTGKVTKESEASRR